MQCCSNDMKITITYIIQTDSKTVIVSVWLWISSILWFQSTQNAFPSRIWVVILYCGTSRTKDMTRTKNRKESVLKNAKSISKMACLINDVGTKSANRGSTSTRLPIHWMKRFLKGIIRALALALSGGNQVPIFSLGSYNSAREYYLFRFN